MSRITRLLNRYSAHTRASVSIMFATSGVMIIATAGIAVDYSRWYNTRTSLQAASDAASLGASQMLSSGSKSDADIKVSVSRYLAENGFPASKLSKLQVTIDRTAGTVDVVAGRKVSPSLSKALMQRDPMVAVDSKAKLTTGKVPLCILALDPGMDGALQGSGGTTWKANGCQVQVNSASSKAVNLSGNSSITSAKNCFVGGISQGANQVAPPAEANCKPVADPFASLPRPAVGACDYNKFSKNKATTLLPGVYCGGINLQNVSFTLSPGLYIIKDGAFTTSGSAAIAGKGVSIYMTGTGTGVTWSGGGTYDLSAQTTGPLAGFVIYVDPTSTPLSKSVISGSGNTSYEGILYFPNQKLEISGTGSVSTPSPFTAFVANNFLFTGGSTLSINVDATKTTVPIPAGLYQGIGGTMLLN
jgi:Flp pilus assembly protein TadG